MLRLRLRVDLRLHCEVDRLRAHVVNRWRRFRIWFGKLPVVIRIFCYVWEKELDGREVRRVTGWRSASINDPTAAIHHVTFCPRWFD